MSKPSPLPFPIELPFIDHLGITLHGMAGGHTELRVQLEDLHQNGWGVAHGGVVMTMLDVAMAMAARSLRGGPGGVATIEMKTSFMRPAEGELRVLGKVVHATATLAFCAAELFDDKGQLCASGTGTFKYLRAIATRDGLKAAPTAASDPHPHPKD